MTQRIKVLNIIGTRPEAVKMAPVVNAMQADFSIESITLVTAQHREMMDQVLRLFQISPDIDLNLMQPAQTLSGLTAHIIDTLDPIITSMKPDWVIAQGDTTTVMTAALTAYYHQIKFGHVEAGLRTFNIYEPFPEEINRRIAGTIATAHFAPTETSKRNLLNENIPAKSIFVTGNTVIDAVQSIATHPIPNEMKTLLNSIGEKKLILVTAHRRENFGKPIIDICAAVAELAIERADELHFVYPVHLNPNIDGVVRQKLSGFSNITLLAPLDYLSMAHLVKNSHIVLTDSGGLQEEAPSFGKPVLVLRNVTERPEGVDAGTVKLVGTDPSTILLQVRSLLDDSKAYDAMAQSINPYGDGNSAPRILEAIKSLS